MNTLFFWAGWAAILYAYVVFPVILAVLAKVHGQRKLFERNQPAAELPKVAMIVAAYNEAGCMADKLANTWALDYPADRFEILIGSDGSGDGTAEILGAASDSRLRAFPFSQRRGKVSVLNDLVQRTDAEILVMSDANTMFAPDAVRQLVRHFQDNRVGCVSGELHLEQSGGVSGEGLYWKYENWIKRNESRLGFVIGCNGGIFALRRELYTPLPASTVVEDFVLTLQVLAQGFWVHFDPEARASEPPCPSARAEMIRKIRIGAGSFQALGLTRSLLHPKSGLRAFAYWGHKVMRWLVPIFFLISGLANIALATHPLYQALLAAQAIGAVVAICAYRARPGVHLPRWTRPISYFYLMNYALFCGLMRFLFRTQRVTWDRAAR